MRLAAGSVVSWHSYSQKVLVRSLDCDIHLLKLIRVKKPKDHVKSFCGKILARARREMNVFS